MKTTSKLGALSALTLILAAGCATEGTQNFSSRPVDLLDARANTYPAMRSGIDHEYNQDYIVTLPPAVIVESAGSDRLKKVE